MGPGAAATWRELASCESWEAVAWRWEALNASLWEGRAGPVALADGDYLYVIGGRDKNNIQLKSVERYANLSLDLRA